MARMSPLSGVALDAWRNFLRANSRLTRELDHELHESHNTSLGDFDVLIQLDLAPRGRLKMCDLAAAIVLSPSGLSRRVDRLERAGLVKRERGSRDHRNVETHLTAAGKRRLAQLRKTHLTGVKERFADRFSAAELETLAELLGRLWDAEDIATERDRETAQV
jgi:DNA-binding MarR family transcriptional regulator